MRGFDTIGDEFPTYLGLSLLLAGIPGFLGGYLTLDPAGTDSLSFVASPAYWGSFLLASVSGALLQATIIRSAILSLNGSPADVTGSVAGMLRRIGPLVGLSILSSIIVGVGLLLLVVPGLIASVALAVAVPVLVEEKLGIVESMERSAALTKGSRWRIFLMLLILAFFYIIISSAFGVGLMVSGYRESLLWAFFEGLSATFFGLLMAGMVASLYVELRTVKEGATTDSL
ncbi:MAG: DUF975 family protein, partial [Gammaproteobacteria bacterium]